MLSRHGDPLEMLERTVDFEYFRDWLVERLGYGDGGKGGRPPFDPVAMFKILILQAQHNLSDARMEYMIRDRLSWMRFLDFALGDRTPDENTIRHFRNRITETGTLKRVMKAFDWQLHKKGYIPMSGQIIDASLVPAPKQRNTDDERQAIKDGKPLPMIALPVSAIKADRRYGFIRAAEITSAAHADGRMLRHVIAENRSSEVWADTAYRSRAN